MFDIGLPGLGILILVASIVFTLRTIDLLRTNKYTTGRSYFVLLLLFMFVVGYGALIFVTATDYELPVDPLTVVGVVYFFGAIFTLVSIDSTYTTLKAILGRKLSDEEAKAIFRTFTEIDEKIPLDGSYTIACDSCDDEVTFTVADVVRSNASALERGISVESVFGVKSYILRPQHICNEGRREQSVIFDHELKVRSIERSRLLFKEIQ